MTPQVKNTVEMNAGSPKGQIPFSIIHPLSPNFSSRGHRAVFPSCVCFSFLQIQNNEGTGQLGRLHSLETIGVTVTKALV